MSSEGGTSRRVAADDGAVRGDAMANAGETFNFSSKNFSCSLRRPEYIARPATRRGEIKIHATARLFSAACLRGIRRASCRAKRNEGRRRTSPREYQRETRRDTLRGSVGNLPKFANQIHSLLARALARARTLFRANYRF